MRYKFFHTHVRTYLIPHIQYTLAYIYIFEILEREREREREMRRGFGKFASFALGSIAGGVVVANSLGQKHLISNSTATNVSHGGRLHHALKADHPSRAAVMGSTSKMRVPPSSKRSKVYSVVLTGGPCGGKSSALKDFTKKLNEHGYDGTCFSLYLSLDLTSYTHLQLKTVYTAPEVPTIMINGGCQYPGMEGKEELDEFETALLKLQLQMESSFTQCAASTGRPSVLVLDRGLMDPAAYLPTEQWQAILEKNGFKEEDFLSRYDLVLHLVTAADGAEKFYVYNDGTSKGNNSARKETPEQARVLDAKIKECWVHHKNQAIIHNGRPFKAKIEEATGKVIEMIDGAEG
jgi:hypothetical protein